MISTAVDRAAITAGRSVTAAGTPGIGSTVSRAGIMATVTAINGNLIATQAGTVGRRPRGVTRATTAAAATIVMVAARDAITRDQLQAAS